MTDTSTVAEPSPTILFVSTPSGIGGSTRSLANVLSDLDDDVHRVVTTNREGRFLELVRTQGLADEELPIVSNETPWRPLRRALSAVRLAIWLWPRRREVRAVHANGLKELNLSMLAIALTRVPLVVWVHNHGHPPSIRAFGRIWARLLSRRDVRWAAVSPLGRDVAVTAGLVDEPDVRIVPNPIDPTDVLARHHEDAPVIRIGFLGSPERYKGFHLLPEIIDRTSGLGVTYLIFANETAACPEAWAELRRLCESGVVELAGKDSDVAEAYARCDIVICPSLRDSFCRVAAEAMMNAIPVVGADLEPIKDLLGDDEAGMLFPSGDVDAAAKAVETLVGDAALRERMGAEGRRRVERFAPRTVAQQLRSLYGLTCPGVDTDGPERGQSAPLLMPTDDLDACHG